MVSDFYRHADNFTNFKEADECCKNTRYAYLVAHVNAKAKRLEISI